MPTTLPKLRTLIAVEFGATRDTYALKMACEDRIVTVSTPNPTSSIQFIEQLAQVPGEMTYFQHYGTDGFEDNGSVFVFGGSADFLRNCLEMIQASGFTYRLN